MYISGVSITSLHREGHGLAFFSGGRDICGDRLGRCQTLQGGDLAMALSGNGGFSQEKAENSVLEAPDLDSYLICPNFWVWYSSETFLPRRLEGSVIFSDEFIEK